MGKLVHVIKKHADYGNTQAFNWGEEKFKDLLTYLGCEVCGEEYSDEFECDEDEYNKALSFLKSYQKDKESKEVKTFMEENDIDDETLELSFKGLGGLDEIVESMQGFWDEREKGYGWISFHAW